MLAPQESDRSRQILSLGEAKWGEVMGTQHVERLARARDLLARKGYGTSGTVLACYSAAGFNGDLRTLAAANQHIRLITLDDMYSVSR